METSSPRLNALQAELNRRRKTAVLTIGAMVALTIGLSLIAYFGKNLFHYQNKSSLDSILKITILSFGLGAVVLRRMSLSANRLKDIAARKGAAGLLRSLLTTTLQVALLGATISVLGFIATVMTGDNFYTYRAGLVGLVVLLYSYPTRASWQRALKKFVVLGPESQSIVSAQPVD